MIRKLIQFLPGLLIFAIILINPMDIIGLNPRGLKALAIALLMVYLWITEVIPMPVTSLLPLVLFPLMGVVDLKEAAVPYASPVIFLFLGGFLLALAVEKWKLHMRIALWIIQWIGFSPSRIMGSFLLASALLSMWISNTATAVIMLPIGLSIIRLLSSEKTFLEKEMKKFSVGILLSVAYGATIGGMATLIASPPNMILVGYLNQYTRHSIDFAEWLMFGMPMVILSLFVAYILIARTFFRIGWSDTSIARRFIQQEISGLGKISKAEVKILIVFLVTIALWLFRSSINHLLDTSLLTDTSIIIMAGIFLFILSSGNKEQKTLLEWKDTKNLAWDVIILFGGAISLAGALDQTGVISTMGLSVMDLEGVGNWGILILLLLIIVVLTEFISATALSSVVIPVVIAVSMGRNISSLFLIVPATLACNLAFMTPMGTPPNAIIYSANLMKLRDFRWAGLVLKIILTALLLIPIALITRNMS